MLRAVLPDFWDAIGTSALAREALGVAVVVVAWEAGGLVSGQRA